MEENSSAPKTNKLTKLAFWEVGLFEIFFAGIVLILLFGILNYFNILSVSDVFPKQLGWLPKQLSWLPKQQNNSTTVAINPFCKHFPYSPGVISCQEAVKTATTDTKGEVKKISIGPIFIGSSIQKILKIQNQKVWYIDIELEKPIIFHNGNAIRALRIEIPVDGSKGIYREPINL
jgi:hypothetical protein